MGLSPSGSHHRRRSSVLTNAGASSLAAPTEQREDHSRAIGEGVGYKRDEQRPLTADEADMSDLSSIAESVELGVVSSDDELHDDEEIGLTAKQRRRQRRQRRKQRRQLDARIAGVKASRYDPLNLGLADQDVIKKLLVNIGLILLWYFFSLSISVYNKWMFSKDHVVFPFPLFTTSVHMAVQFTLASFILWLIPSLRPRHPPSALPGDPTRSSHDATESRPVLTKLFYLTRLVPCGAATSLDIGLGNMSLKFISLTFLTMCKSSALAFVLLFAFLFRLETPSVKLIIIIAAMTVGVVMMVAGETAFNAVGFALVIASAFFSGFRWGLTQILLLRHPATSNPFSTLFFLTPVMFVCLIIIALAVEGPTQIGDGITALSESHGGGFAIFLLIFPGVLAFCMIAAEFSLLKRSSVVTLSICGIFKEVITISAAGIVFHDQLTAVNITGLVVTIASIGCYNYMKISKMRDEARQGATWERSPNLDSESDDSDPAYFRERGTYHRIDDQETSMVAPVAHVPVDDNLHLTSADGLTDERRSFQGRASGASSNVRGLKISTSNLSDSEGRPFSPRLAGPSPLKSAPPVVLTPDSQFPPRVGRGPSPGASSQSSADQTNPAGRP
ncbi:putative nucleotide-sugar transporter [Aspergillus clavatus NRRL 1]|uniref:Nucleotide-sugar transporter, putative n=1 Tax=Aspergillus clavatus (strain ATCC 1007 / CBS 513.65 / DSM 816 / NCTC 3887 / NRRL 1 / QM 1276 / 107) TaxID=344612 RepID=A1CTC8_ASPCL|nr:nucleotide-sugar transporter, putative [Aspergillus clavatus NRRL 1]EAW06565.1 nucleotide-sugar transporter, putative [Aspergillus clavatus NRRL 1]